MLQFVIIAVLTLTTGLLAVGDDRLEVEILQGRLSGVRENSVKGRGFYAFRSIPFAKPPVGPLRFKDPEPAGRWKGIRDASSYPPRCIQQPYDLIFLGVKTVDGEEDCLYLNVYTPTVEVQARLPVMVWIHGGGFFAGESFSYPPHAILERDVILVVIQYRLGIFGFLSTEDLVIPGNFGLKDQTLALRWVQQNIGHFGGDPNRVTIFGESAGGASVNFQMLIPEAKGLFSRAIMQSGCALNHWAIGDIHGEVARHLGHSVGCSLQNGSQDFLECMQKENLPAETLSLALSNTFEFLLTPVLMTPRVDGNFLPNQPEVLMGSGNFHKVPVISGVVKDEGATISQFIFSNAELKEKIIANFSIVPMSLGLKGRSRQMMEEDLPRAFERIIGNVNFDDKDAEAITQIYSTVAFMIGHDGVSLLSSRYHPVYAYEFEYRGHRSFSDFIDMDKTDPALAQKLRSWITHADDLHYLFNSGLVQPLEDPTDLSLRDIVVSLWTNFASTGNPTPGNSLGFKWEKVSASSFKHLVLKPQPYMEEDTRSEIREYWMNFPAFANLKKQLQKSG
ncbi:juvenile hormone esterase-like [Oratosquilla oratoria]|uniref:juvenile hormone esterase-like n=1 Tax=Oratosquilla oratoria TaxID=337810 RepID=UPI003F76AC09